MPVETELKLRITPQQLDRLKRHALLREHQLTRPVARRLHNIYYDTPRLELQESGMALRLRRAGRQWLQTLKGGGSVKAGLHQRNEWEIPVPGEALDFSSPQAAEWNGQLPPSLRKKLRPVFVTDFSRSSRMLDWHGAQIELCMDRGEVRAGQHSAPICELELELKSGEPRQLFELALAILEVVPFELETVSKAEQGYRLLSGFVERPVRNGVPELNRSATLADALQALIWSCLLHWQGNLRGAMGSGDMEYLHQMRVALRRLRVVLRMAAKACADEQLIEFGKEVAALCVVLGRNREWDVFIAQTVRPMCERMPGHPGLQVLLECSGRQRDAHYAALRDEARSRGMQRLILRFAIWMNGPYWSRAELALPVGDFAARRLRKLDKRFVQAGQHLDFADAGWLHALRILTKKLRYSAEFFAALYDKRRIKPYLAALGGVQDALGQINDVAVAHRLLDELAATAALSAHQEAIALSRGWIAHDLSHQFAVLSGAIKRFSKQSSFREKAR